MSNQTYHALDVERSFRLFARLMREGKVASDSEEYREYTVYQNIRDLAEMYSREVECVIEKTGEFLYLIPRVKNSYFQIKKSRIKEKYFPAGATNLDIYLMYFATLVLFGAFYNSYESSEPTRDFLPFEEWMRLIHDHLKSMGEHRAELEEESEIMEWNWSGVVERWEALDDLREQAKKVDARQNTRIGYLHRYYNFLADQDLVTQQGNQEIVLTEKAKVIVQRYFMNKEHNRGVLQFMYQFDQVTGEDS